MNSNNTTMSRGSESRHIVIEREPAIECEIETSEADYTSWIE